MSSPVYLTYPPGVTVDAIVTALRESGIEVSSNDRSPDGYICTRGRVGFELWVQGDESGTLSSFFTADLSQWRWWNFLFLWLWGLVRARSDYRMQMDAYLALRPLGADHHGYFWQFDEP